jgi:hypothetical protein
MRSSFVSGSNLETLRVPTAGRDDRDRRGRAVAIAGRDLVRAIDAHLNRKANFDPNQPRIPKGEPHGGQWTGSSGRGRGSSVEPSEMQLRTSRPSVDDPPSSNREPGVRVTIGPSRDGWPSNGGPSLDGPQDSASPPAAEQLPPVSKERPRSQKLALRVVKAVAKAGLNLLFSDPRIRVTVTLGHWLYEEYSPYLQA